MVRSSARAIYARLRSAPIYRVTRLDGGTNFEMSNRAKDARYRAADPVEVPDSTFPSIGSLACSWRYSWRTRYIAMVYRSGLWTVREINIRYV